MLINLLQHFDRGRHDVRVCVLAIRAGNPIAAEIRALGIPVDQVLVSGARDVGGVLRLARYLRQHRVDLLHVQLQASNTFGCPAARLVGIPSVSTLHTYDAPKKGTSSYWRQQLAWWVLRHFCTRVIAVSEGTRQHHIRAGRLRPERIITMYNGIDLSRFTNGTGQARQRARAELGIPADAPTMLSVAVLRPAKGIQFMIEAMPRILDHVPEARYVVVGGGEHEAALKALAVERGVTDRVIFTGMRSDIPELLALADLFVHPTLDDALPTVLAEAMASHTPIVASAVGGVPEMVEDGVNGLLVPPGDADALAAVCIDLLGQPDRLEALGEAGRRIAAERFDVVKQVNSLHTLYDELIAAAGRSG